MAGRGWLMRLVELFGPPAVGKTTLIDALGLSIIRSETSIATDWVPEGISAEYRNYIGRSARRRESAKRLPGEWAIDGGGLCQWGVSLGVHNEEFMGVYFEVMPLPDLAVACIASFGVLLERNRARPSDRNHEKDLLNWLWRTAGAINALQLRNIDVLRLDMTQPIDVNAHKVRDHL